MKTTEVTIKLTRDQEWDLMSKYGRRCTPEGLVMRAIADAVKTPAVSITKTEPKRRKRKEKADGKEPAQVTCVCSFAECPWKGDAVPGDPCPVCSSELVEAPAA